MKIKNISNRIICTSKGRIYPDKEVTIPDAEGQYLCNYRKEYLVPVEPSVPSQESTEVIAKASPNSKTKKHWINDGSFNKLVPVNDPLEKGWRKGRIKK